VEFYLNSNEPMRAYVVLKQVVFPWLPLIKRRDEGAAERYLQQLEEWSTNDPAFAASIASMRERLSTVEAVDRELLWF
jgi:hypothetical protein